VSISTPAGAVTDDPVTPDPVAPVPDPKTEILSAPLRNSFDYTRSLGPVLSRFALALRDGHILGSRSADGRVFVPPTEFDPATGAASTDLVEVAPTGTVTTWTWQAEPTAGQPLSEPFAWALITLDGADTALLHAVACEPGQISTGARVHAVFRAARTGRIDDISHFQLGSPAGRAPAGPLGPAEPDHPQVIITTRIESNIDHCATAWESDYLRALKAGKLIGSRIGSGIDAGRVYFPPRGESPADGAPAVERVELPDTGIVTTFCIVNVPFTGQRIKPPYVAAYVLIDGTDIPVLHLILDCPADEVRMGMRVRAVWVPEDRRELSMGSISHFTPTGEPDADYQSYRDHV